jgi:hypothetical protein
MLRSFTQLITFVWISLRVSGVCNRVDTWVFVLIPRPTISLHLTAFEYNAPRQFSVQAKPIECYRKRYYGPRPRLHCRAPQETA